VRWWLVGCAALLACPPPRVPTVVVAPGTSAERALLDAEAAFAKRPDVDAVKEALRLFQTAAVADAVKVEGPVGVVRVAAWLVENGPKGERKLRADEAVAAGQQCQQRAAATATCDYWQAVALGLSAREHALTALGELPRIISLLKRADAAAPDLDEAGPARVLALLLVRAPGWPTGPGNPDDALVEAQKAVARAPQHPLNQATLAECLAATGDTAGAKAAYARAVELGTARGDADGALWAAQARTALAALE
jgi:tetratricopeptide (TPR) repeat protein